ncbi:hypothetical protein Dimus_029086 [Dionaea muscipula]
MAFDHDHFPCRAIEDAEQSPSVSNVMFYAFCFPQFLKKDCYESFIAADRSMKGWEGGGGDSCSWKGDFICSLTHLVLLSE